MFPSIFNTFKFQIYTNIRHICDPEDMYTTLAQAMAKPYSQGKKLDLLFIDEFNQPMKDMFTNFAGNITTLTVDITSSIGEFMSDPNFILNSLEDLTLHCGVTFFNLDKMEQKRPVIEDMINRHASQLTHLKINNYTGHLQLMNMPRLEALTLWDVGSEVAWNIFELCKGTITWLEIDGIRVEEYSPSQSDEILTYDIPSLMVLKLGDIPKNFVFNMVNTDNLVALTLQRDINIPIEFSTLPKLKELTVGDQKWLPLLLKCRATLEFLMYTDYTPLDWMALELPRLSDLIILAAVPGVSQYCNNFFALNHKNLEFAFLWQVDPVRLPGDFKMVKMEKVIMRSSIVAYSHQDLVDMAELCPKANVYHLGHNMTLEDLKEVRGFVKSRIKQKGFKLDIESLALT